MNRRSLILIVLFLALSLFGRDLWQQHFDLGGSINEGRDITVASDGNIYVTGRSNAWAEGGFRTNNFDHEAFLIKIAPDGDELWTNHYGQVGAFHSGGNIYGYYDAGWGIESTSDGGCIIVGKTQSPKWTEPMISDPDCIGWDNMLIIRIDADGDTLWTKGYGGFYYDRGWSIKQIPGTTDYIIIGTTHTLGPGAPSEAESNIWLAKVDSAGNMLGEVSFGEAGEVDDARWVATTSDGGYAFTGYYNRVYADDSPTDTFDIDYTELCIVKTNSDLETLWELTFPEAGDDRGRGIVGTPDGGVAVAVRSKSRAAPEFNRTHGWLIRVGPDGDTLWTKILGSDSLSDPVNSIDICEDNGFILGGSTRTYNPEGGTDAWLVRTDSLGNIIWQQNYFFGRDNSDVIYSVRAHPDGGFVATGYTKSFGYVDYSDVIALKTDATGSVDWIYENEKVEYPQLQAEISPNPFSNYCNIELEGIGSYSKIQIFDTQGKLIRDLGRVNSARWDGKTDSGKKAPAGIYLVRVTGSIAEPKRIVYMR
ncbi:MAG: T9SS type A sorting domain-containing protein [Candidatus Zixiibacteriota bacterium]